MSILLWILGIYWFIASAVIFLADIRDDYTEEETITGNIVYYVVLVPAILLGELIVEVIHFFRRRL